MEQFRFEITDEEKKYLKAQVVRSISSGLRLPDAPVRPDDPPTEKLRESLGAFVTLKLGGRLRGCIGMVQGQGELYRTIWDMAQRAAFEDPRFPPVSAEEFERLEYEISILSPIEPCPDAALVEVGRHGLIMMRGGRSGLLLPQVPVEWKWDRETFLAQTCLKAGLDRDAWLDPSTSIFWFEAVVF
ncbi:AmmeMemoRadiSam system protein A [Pseudodesulfovibrio sp.]|uniref:AmmeMemoRadiSam system protein A n=1 Tax=unclassified Pseudodesulfovibrio TaxID=2661612 RepID=UPI003B00053B